MKKTDILGWLVTVHLFVMILVMLKYKTILFVQLYGLANAGVGYWIHININKKEDIIDKCDKVRGQWG